LRAYRTCQTVRSSHRSGGRRAPRPFLAHRQARTRDLPGEQLAAFAERAAHPLCKLEATTRASVAPAVADRAATGFLGLAMMPAAARRPGRDRLQG
jgi:hypothetical protein